METIHTRIRQRRKELGLSLEDLAKALSVSFQTIQQWENEPDPNNPGVKSTAPKRSRMEDVARALQTSVAWLATGNESHEYKLSHSEEQILLFYRGMSQEAKEAFEQTGNTLYNMSNGNAVNAANPFAGKKAPR